MDFERTPLHKMTRGQRMRACLGPDWREQIRDGVDEPREPGQVALKGEYWGEVRGPDGRLKFRHCGHNTIQDALLYEVAQFFGALTSGNSCDVDELSYFDFYDDTDTDWGHTATVTLNAGGDLSHDYVEVVGAYTADEAQVLGNSRVYSTGAVLYSEVDFGASTVSLSTDDTYTYTYRLTFTTATEASGVTIADIFDYTLAYPFAPGQGSTLSPMIWYTDFKDGSWGNEVICTLYSGGTGAEDNATVSATYTATSSVTVTDVRLRYAGTTYMTVDLSGFSDDVALDSGETFTARWKVTVA
jgi:hypothetical protein